RQRAPFERRPRQLDRRRHGPPPVDGDAGALHPLHPAGNGAEPLAQLEAALPRPGLDLPSPEPRPPHLVRQRSLRTPRLQPPVPPAPGERGPRIAAVAPGLILVPSEVALPVRLDQRHPVPGRVRVHPVERPARVHHVLVDVPDQQPFARDPLVEPDPPPGLQQVVLPAAVSAVDPEDPPRVRDRAESHHLRRFARRDPDDVDPAQLLPRPRPHPARPLRLRECAAPPRPGPHQPPAPDPRPVRAVGRHGVIQVREPARVPQLVHEHPDLRPPPRARAGSVTAPPPPAPLPPSPQPPIPGPFVPSVVTASYRSGSPSACPSSCTNTPISVTSRPGRQLRTDWSTRSLIRIVPPP